MKIYSLNPVSIHQQDDKMNYNIPATVSPGMFHETATKIAEASQDVFENAVNNMVKSEAMYQKKESDENNLYSRNVNFEKKVELTNPNLKEIINPDRTDVREYVENGNANIYEAAGGTDDDFCYELPIHDKKLYIYTKCMHPVQCNEVKGGLVVPEEQGGACKKTSCGACKTNNASGVSFSEGVAFNNNDLDSIINNLNSKGGAIPAVVAELAMNLATQIPSIISAIKAKRDQSKVGNGLLNNMQKYDTVRAVMNNLPEGKPAVYYNNMIKTFNALKRSASGISFNSSDNTYYASGKVTDGLKNFWNKVKSWYNDNKEVFAPIKDALLNTATNTINKTVNNASNKLTDYVTSKTNNEDIKNITKAVTDVTKNISQQGIDMIKGNGIEPEKIYSVLN
ncbi:MAG: hypothetical protein SOV80_03545 [Bacilli bacterium]|nr:hypothetical protein [bacterium]MDY2697283.1 hypothetical protein [Bacilli bacterium]